MTVIDDNSEKFESATSWDMGQQGSDRSLPLAQILSDEVLRDRFMFVIGLGWYAWDGRVWSGCDDDTLIDPIKCWIERQADPSTRSVPPALGVHRYLTLARARELVSAASTIPALRRLPQDLDARSYLLNVNNGVLDLKTGALGEHLPELMMTRITSIDYDPAATHPDWDAVLAAVGDERTQSWLAKFIGAAATGAPDRGGPITFLFGSGSNGKSSLLAGVRAALGDYAGPVPDALLVERSREHATMWMTLRGLRLAYLEELPDQSTLPSAMVKKLAETSELSARKMHQDYLTFLATHSLLVTTNNHPKVTDTSTAMWRRLAMVPFTTTFAEATKDVTLRERMSHPDQAQAVLAWIAAGARAWIEGGKSLEPYPPAVRAETDQWRNESDVLRQFLNDTLEVTGDTADTVPTVALHEQYTIWAHGQNPLSQTAFSTRLKGHPFLTENGLRVARPGRTAATSLIGVRLRDAGSTDTATGNG